ncbi:hypothetical protein [Pyrobaculum islandicum]
MYTYRTLKVEIPRQLVEERLNVLDLVTRMHLAVEEYVKELLKEVTGQEEPKLTTEELDCLLTLDRREMTLNLLARLLREACLR